MCSRASINSTNNSQFSDLLAHYHLVTRLQLFEKLEFSRVRGAFSVYDGHVNRKYLAKIH